MIRTIFETSVDGDERLSCGSDAVPIDARRAGGGRGRPDRSRGRGPAELRESGRQRRLRRRAGEVDVEAVLERTPGKRSRLDLEEVDAAGGEREESGVECSRSMG